MPGYSRNSARVEQHDQVGAGGRRRLVARRPEGRVRRPRGDVDDVVVDSAGRGVPAIPEGAHRRPRRDQRIVAESQLGDDLGVQAEEERIDERRVGGQGDDRVVEQRARSGQQPLRRVVAQELPRRKVEIGNQLDGPVGLASTAPASSITPSSTRSTSDGRAMVGSNAGAISVLARSMSKAVATGWRGGAPPSRRVPRDRPSPAPRRGPRRAHARARATGACRCRRAAEAGGSARSPGAQTVGHRPQAFVERTRVVSGSRSRRSRAVDEALCGRAQLRSRAAALASASSRAGWLVSRANASVWIALGALRTGRGGAAAARRRVPPTPA